MSVKKYQWLVGTAVRRKGDIVELDDDQAKVRLILKHVKLIEEKIKEVKIIYENEIVKNEVREYFKDFVNWTKVEYGVDGICFNKKDKKKVMKVLPDLLEKGYVVEDEVIKSIKGDRIRETKLYFV
jgi:hypothetical protein